MCIQERWVVDGLLTECWLLREEFATLGAVILKWEFQVGQSSFHMRLKCNLDQSWLELDLRKHRCLPHVPKTCNQTRTDGQRTES